jgi:hypothetical protein
MLSDYESLIDLAEYPPILPIFDLAPDSFVKKSPANEVDAVVLNPNLEWEISDHALDYEYCIDTSDDNACETDWISTGSSTSVTLSNLRYETTYYWQVRAVNNIGTKEADDGWWSFTTADGVAPGPFTKIGYELKEPLDSLSKVTLNWTSSYGAYYYEVCVDTEADCTAPELWHNVGVDTTATFGGLQLETTYYWQVRAWNGFDNLGDEVPEEEEQYYTYADTGTLGSFTTRTFSKLRPLSNEIYNLTLPFKWEESSFAKNGYQYCISTVNGNCTTSWKSTTDTSVVINFNKEGWGAGTYYWQVLAVDEGVVYEANDGVWWQFEVLSKKDLKKISLLKENPVNGAVDQPTADLELSWSSKGTPRKYEYCIFSGDNTCTLGDENWVFVGDNSTLISDLGYTTNYFWQVRTNLGTEDEPEWLYADNGDYWEFTTAPEPAP